MGAGVQIVEDNSLRTTSSGYELKLRINWYRSLPLSCVEKIELSLDGQPVEASAIRLEVNGHQFALAELDALVEEYWFVQDSARLIVQKAGGLTKDQPHQIKLEYALRFPYIVIGPGRFLVNTSKYAASQIAA